MRNKLFFVVSLLIMASMLLAACAPAAAPEATAEPVKEWKSADPTTYVSATFGDPETLDPALCYETAGGQIIQNTYDTLIFYNRENPNEFIPQLALEVPSKENGLISEDGLTYTFNVRKGVKFHDGTEMTPEDVAYSFQRALLQGNTASPVWMYMEPFFGIGYSDIAEIVAERVAAAWETSLDDVVAGVDLVALTEAAGAVPPAPEATEAPAAEEGAPAATEEVAPAATEEVAPAATEEVAATEETAVAPEEVVAGVVKQLVVDAAAAHTAVSGLALTVPDDIDLSGFDVAGFLAAADDAAKQAALKTFAMDTVSGLEGADVYGFIDAPDLLAAADPAILLSVAEDAQKAIVADNAAGTVVFTLAQPFAPFLPTIANSWGSVTSKAWVSANGGWDGDPATWQTYYGKTSEQINETPIGVTENGTGPYKLDHWTPGEEIVLVANEEYWRTEPAWEGGPSGAPALKTVIIKAIDEFSTRFAMLEAGDADSIVTGSMADYPQMDTLVGVECQGSFDSCTDIDAEKPLKVAKGLESISRTDLFFALSLNAEGGNNFIGSGALDGDGIPVNFFQDPHVRKGFAYCFNYDAYLEDVFLGEGIRSNNVMLPGMIGYEDESPIYTYDVEKCTAELQASKWRAEGDGFVPDEAGDISLWDTGFRFTAAYNTGNTSRQTAAQILQTELNAVNENFVVEVTGLPWPTFLRNQRAKKLPIFFSGWLEDIHDPHNWVVPYTTGTYGGRQGLPQELKDQYSEIISRAVSETDPAARAEIYKEFNQLWYDQAHTITLFVPTARRYEQRWVKGWYNNPIYPNTYYYPISKE